ncbi:prefoldin-like protein, putative [Theileria annulata]|uniref:Prefoldin-like protein, putative n=1 Tax=Theileria annulata TaxID=5874 RepID=Q4UG58_THEAN|nr:prefoldin-like protein, putative [Theileria annulata]CAI73931.1 prefoldin-like protein, putative [Theileria annulata]|eukprot:XP_954608.1 prefoldin-like protein, putative [Theileria annulata]
MTTPLDDPEKLNSDADARRLENFSIQELNMLILKLEEEVNELQSLVNALTIAMERFQESKKALLELEKKNKQIQVPLTSLVYVPVFIILQHLIYKFLGELTNPDKVLVSVGTGYYVEMDLKKGEDYYERYTPYQFYSIRKGKTDKFELFLSGPEVGYSTKHTTGSSNNNLNFYPPK